MPTKHMYAVVPETHLNSFMALLAAIEKKKQEPKSDKCDYCRTRPKGRNSVYSAMRSKAEKEVLILCKVCYKKYQESQERYFS